MDELTKTVSFRLPAAHAKQLSDRGAKENLSIGEYARTLVLAVLTNTSSARSGDDLAAVHKSLDALREDLATATVAVLVGAGKTTAAEAEDWVRKTLLR